MGYPGCEMLAMWDVEDLGCCECGMLGMLDVGDVGCWECGMLEMWDVWDEACIPGCGMLIYKMQMHLGLLA